jgi:outer membrane protein assembly factor BamB
MWIRPPSLALFVLALAASVQAEEWPGWRGPRGDGTSTETGLPIHWSRTENVRWKTNIPGKGHSSPIVWGDRVFVTTCVESEGKRLLLCLDRNTGTVLWERLVLTATLEKKHNLNSYASATPATDGQHVWVAFEERQTMQVACYDFQGNKAWQQSPGEFHSQHGFCSSPVLYKDLVILNGDQDAVAYIVALDRATGAERWRADRPNRTRSYCPPLLIDAAGKKQLVLSGSKCVASYDPDTGKQIWLLDGPTEQFVASQVYQDGLVFLTTGFPEFHLMGIHPDGEGNITGSRHIAWHHGNVGSAGASYVPSPIAFEHYFFVVADVGFLHCLDTKTGTRLWRERLGPHHSASPVSAGGYLYFVDDEGTTFVIKPGPRCQVVAQNRLEERCSASPAVAHGQLFLRTLEHLYCIKAGARAP